MSTPIWSNALPGGQTIANNMANVVNGDGSDASQWLALRNMLFALQARMYPGQLSWDSDDLISLGSWSGDPTPLTAVLQDGKQRRQAASIQLDLTSGVGELGLDTGARTVSTWYHIYSVPQAADDDLLTARFSVTPPAPLGAGPTGFPNHVYRGAVRNNASDNLIQFDQLTRERFSYRQRIEPADSATWGATRQNPQVNMSTVDVAPITANAIDLVMSQRRSAAMGNTIIQEIWVDGLFGVAQFAILNNTINNDWRSRRAGFVPLNSNRRITYRSRRDGGSAEMTEQHVYANGWIDPFV